MPLHQLAVAPADVSGSRLALALNARRAAATGRSRLTHPDGGALLLEVLGASHVVTVEHPGNASPSRSRAPRQGHGGDLPKHAEAPGYRLESRIEATTRRNFAGSHTNFANRCATETGWLGGVFPGDDAALTALVAEPDGTGWRWQTWHLYPRHRAGHGGPHRQPVASMSRQQSPMPPEI